MIDVVVGILLIVLYSGLVFAYGYISGFNSAVDQMKKVKFKR